MRHFIDIIENAHADVVYHGSTTSGSEPQQSQTGMFFTPHRPSAEAYARGFDGQEGELIAARLTLRNPLTITPEWIEQLERDPAIAAAKAAGSSLSLNDAFEDSETWARDIVFAKAHSLGHDAVIIPRDLLPEQDLNGDWDYFVSYAVFDPTTIRVIGREIVAGY